MWLSDNIHVTLFGCWTGGDLGHLWFALEEWAKECKGMGRGCEAVEIKWELGIKIKGRSFKLCELEEQRWVGEKVRTCLLLYTDSGCVARMICDHLHLLTQHWFIGKAWPKSFCLPRKSIWRLSPQCVATSTTSPWDAIMWPGTGDRWHRLFLELKPEDLAISCNKSRNGSCDGNVMEITTYINI